MNRRYALITAAALVLLGTTAGPALAAHHTAASTSRSAAYRPASRSLVTSFFAALDHEGQPGHDYRALARLYAPTITVLESLTTGTPRLHTGLRQVQAFDEANVLRWFVERTDQLSSGVVLTIEQPYTRGPGHELDGAEPWLTLFTLQSGKIVNMIWMPC